MINKDTYKRLTKRRKDGTVGLTFRSDYPSVIADKLKNRLAELEDKITDGTQGFVEWQNAECAFLVNIGDDYQTMDECPYEVISNIYDNTEE